MADRKQLIKAARQLYLQYGIKSVTMQDISQQAGISKKTLYQVVSHKKELVYQVMDDFLQKERDFVEETFSASTNAIDDLFKITTFLSQYTKNLNPVVKFDLQKYYPEAWELFKNHKNEFIYELMYDNMEKGIKQGLYRADINKDVIAKMYTEQIEIMLDPTLFPPEQYNMFEVLKVIQNHHIRGIASRFGIRYLEFKQSEDSSGE